MVREASVAKVAKDAEEMDAIPERNIDLLRRLGVAEMKGRLEACRQCNTPNDPD